MLMKTKILLGLGAGVVGVGGGLLLRKMYLDSLPNDDHRANDMTGDSFGDNRRPVAQAAALAAFRVPQRILPTPPPVTSGGRAISAGRYAGPPGVLKVKILKPDCEIIYDEAHYKGTGLAGYFDNGEIVNWRKGNDIMQWYAWDGPETKGQDSEGKDYKRVHVTGSFYIKYLGLDEFSAKQKGLGSHPPLEEIWDWDKKYSLAHGSFATGGGAIPPRPVASDILGYQPGKSSGAAESTAENYLLAHGYRFVELDPGQTAKLDLDPGWYQIVAKPEWRAQDTAWRYLRGYWHWTKEGPRGKSNSAQWKKFKNHKCTNKLTQFYRIVEQDRWGDISSLVQVVSDKTTSVKVQPLVNLEITNRATKKNAYSNSYYVVCRAYSYSEKIFRAYTGVVGNILWWLMERFFGSTIKKYGEPSQ